MVADLALGSSGAAAKMAPHGSMIFVQLSSAAYAVLTRVILTQGISSTVFLFYQFAIATIFMAALAFIFERITLSQNLLSACLYYISSSLEAAVINLNPVFTFILSIMFRQEELAIHTPWGKGKVFGTILSVSGALTLMLWKNSASSASSLTSSSLLEWVLGLVMVLLGVLALSTWILLLGPMTRSIVGAIMVVVGLYIYLWSKAKEEAAYIWIEGDEEINSSLIV
ncbi:hypothetical protein ACLOJK_011887 [Asimina triloba]